MGTGTGIGIITGTVGTGRFGRGGAGRGALGDDGVGLVAIDDAEVIVNGAQPKPGPVRVVRSRMPPAHVPAGAFCTAVANTGSTTRKQLRAWKVLPGGGIADIGRRSEMLKTRDPPAGSVMCA